MCLDLASWLSYWYRTWKTGVVVLGTGLPKSLHHSCMKSFWGKTTMWANFKYAINHVNLPLVFSVVCSLIEILCFDLTAGKQTLLVFKLGGTLYLYLLSINECSPLTILPLNIHAWCILIDKGDLGLRMMINWAPMTIQRRQMIHLHCFAYTSC